MQTFITPNPSADFHFHHILVPVDTSSTSAGLLSNVATLARQFHSRITLLHVIKAMAYNPEILYPDPLAPEQTAPLRAELEQLRAESIPGDIPVEIVFRYGFVPEQAVRVAREFAVDLIVTTTHGYSGLRHFIRGSLAEMIVRDAPCPVLVVHGNERPTHPHAHRETTMQAM